MPQADRARYRFFGARGLRHAENRLPRSFVD
jgi:hypothetical protein